MAKAKKPTPKNKKVTPKKKKPAVKFKGRTRVAGNGY